MATATPTMTMVHVNAGAALYDRRVWATKVWVAEIRGKAGPGECGVAPGELNDWGVRYFMNFNVTTHLLGAACKVARGADGPVLADTAGSKADTASD